MRQKPHLILTVDYEVFGNGSGCLDACVLQPAERMMVVAERFGAPLTFFAETLEFIAMSAQMQDRRAQRQLCDALARGHDVQLHLHPQWHGARLDEQGRWQLDMDRWRIGDLSRAEAYSLIRLGKRWLEDEVAAHAPGYCCLAFRAGGWCIQPSHHVVQALQAEGFTLDSTVVPGQWRAGAGEWSDFRAAPDLPFWRADGDVCQPAAQGLWEVPIAVGRIGKWRHLASIRASRKLSTHGLAPGCAGSYLGPEGSAWHHWWSKAVRLRQLGSVMLDFSTMSAEVLIAITKQWASGHESGKGEIPVVAIAHTKNFTQASADHLAAYLAWAQREGVIFSTYGRWLAEVAKGGLHERQD